MAGHMHHLERLERQKCRNRIEGYYSGCRNTLPAKAGVFFPYAFLNSPPAFVFLTSSLGLSKGKVGMNAPAYGVKTW